ncbi:putative Zinc finger SWIM domain-containing protein, partial [Naja naja]
RASLSCRSWRRLVVALGVPRVEGRPGLFSFQAPASGARLPAARLLVRLLSVGGGGAPGVEAATIQVVLEPPRCVSRGSRAARLFPSPAFLDVMELMFAEWEDGERFSFEDSDRFEEDSLCSFISEAESLCQNWRGWRKQSAGPNSPTVKMKDGLVIPLVELSAKQVAFHIPFEVVEKVYPPVPEQLQLRIAFWSFPENEEDI